MKSSRRCDIWKIDVHRAFMLNTEEKKAFREFKTK